MSEIDAVAVALIDWVKAAHATGHSVELLTPESLHWYLDAGSRLVLLPLDWGFRAGRGGKAEFFADNSPGIRFLDAHVKPAEFFASNRDEVNRARDWRTVARVLLWAIYEVRGFAHDGGGKSRPPAFVTLQQVLDGTLPTDGKSPFADTLRGALGEVGSGRTIGEALLQEGGGDERPARRGKLWLVLLGLVMLGATAAALAWVFNTTDSPPAPYCPKCPKDSPLYPLLFQFEKVKDDPAAKYRVFEEMWKAKDGSTGQRRAIEDECLDELLRNEVLPRDGGLPAGSSFGEQLAKFGQLIEVERPNPYTNGDRIAEMTGLLKMLKGSPASPIPAVAERERSLLQKAWRNLRPMFVKSGVRFWSEFAGQLERPPAVTEARKLSDAWKSYSSLQPESEVQRPWSDKLERLAASR